MVSFKSLLVVLAVSSSSLASPTRRDEAFKSNVVESLSGPPLGWAKDESVKLNKEDLKISLRIHLVQQDVDKFHELAINVRNPALRLARVSIGTTVSMCTLDSFAKY
jgi:tripeptidyl-peptidase I